MNAVKSEVEKLVQKELEYTNQRFTIFHSGHEGAAAIIDGLQEIREIMDDTDNMFKGLWRCVRHDLNGEPNAEAIYDNSIEMACEAIQVAAMAQKFIDSKKEREKSEDN